MTVGQRLPMLAGAGGRCVAAMLGLSKTEIAERFGELRWANPPTLSAYQQQVGKAGAVGWALDDGDFLSGVTTVAVAIPGASPRRAYVVGATVFSGQISPSELNRVAESLKAQAARIAEALGSQSLPRT
jgi:DNA-binding IclR family transcriptional regulator